MDTLPLLSLTNLVPLLGAIVLFLFVKSDDEKKKFVTFTALAFSLITFVLSLQVLRQFNAADTGFQLVERYMWIPSFNIAYIKGIDGISIWLLLLSTFLVPLGILAAFGSVKKRFKEFMIATLVLEAMMIGVFTSLDLVLFYVFFEGVLLPMFLMIGIWGGERRIYAAFKFFLYTFLGSVVMLIAIFAMIIHVGTSDMTLMMGNKFPKEMAVWLWLAFFASFAVKTPVWPFHTWLPDAYVESPIVAIIFSGVMLKMGSYGFIRIGLQMLPDATKHFAPLMMGLALVAIIYASLVALVQTNMKRMGYILLGIFSLNDQGLDGAMIMTLSHTLVSAGLFVGLGVAYDRLGTEQISRYGGVATSMPRFAVVFMVLTLAAVGLPGTSGFIGEFLVMQGAFLANSWYGLIAILGMVLGAAYMLWLYRRVFFGKIVHENVARLSDLSGRETIIMAPLLVFILWIGIHPATFRDVYAPTLNKVMSDFHSQEKGQAHG
jgi:NADH-quinone oxidoreductase subunit M